MIDTMLHSLDLIHEPPNALRQSINLIGNLRQQCCFNTDGGWELLYAAEEHLLNRLHDGAFPVSRDFYVCDSCDTVCNGKGYEITYFNPVRREVKICGLCWSEQEEVA
jgi:hypothetical protein